MKNENNVFYAVGEDGEKVRYEVICKFEYAVTNKLYIIYTDNTLDENGSIKVYAASSKKDLENVTDAEIKLETVETEEEWAVIEQVLEQIKNKNEEK